MMIVTLDFSTNPVTRWIIFGNKTAKEFLSDLERTYVINSLYLTSKDQEDVERVLNRDNNRWTEFKEFDFFHKVLKERTKLNLTGLIRL